MGLNGKLEAVVEAKSSAESLFKLLAEELHNIPDASSDNVQGVEVHEGNWASAGSVKLWTYTIDGEKEVFKEKVEIDEESRTMTMEAVGGHILNKYKAYKIVYQVLPDGVSSKVKVEIVYEKLDENHAEPENYLRFIVKVLKDTDAHIIGKQHVEGLQTHDPKSPILEKK